MTLCIRIRDLHLEQCRAECLAVCVQCERLRHTTADHTVENEVQRTQFGQLVAHDISGYETDEVLLDSLGGRMSDEPRIVTLLVRDERDVHDGPLVTAPAVGDRSQLHLNSPATRRGTLRPRVE